MSAEQKGTVDKGSKKITAPDLKTNQDYTIVGTGTSKYLREGVEYTVSGADAIDLIESGKATLK